MNTEEILLTCLLVLTIACMLLRPFVAGQPVRRTVRRKAHKASVPGTETYRLSRQMQNKGYVPEASPVGIGVPARKFPSIHRFGRKRNHEAYSNR